MSDDFMDIGFCKTMSELARFLDSRSVRIIERMQSLFEYSYADIMDYDYRLTRIA